MAWSSFNIFRIDWYFDFIIISLEYNASQKYVVQNSRIIFRAILEIIRNFVLILSQNPLNFFWNSGQKIMFKVKYSNTINPSYTDFT